MKTATSTALLLSSLMTSTSAFIYESQQLPSLVSRDASEIESLPHLLRRMDLPDLDKIGRTVTSEGGFAYHNLVDNRMHAMHDSRVLPETNRGTEQYQREHGHPMFGTWPTTESRKASGKEDREENADLHKTHPAHTRDAQPWRAVDPPHGIDRTYHTVPSHENRPQAVLASQTATVGRNDGADGIVIHPDPRGRSASLPGSRTPSAAPKARSRSHGASPDPPAQGTRSKKNRREVEQFWNGYAFAMEVVEREAMEMAFYDDLLFEREAEADAEAEPEVWFEEEEEWLF